MSAVLARVVEGGRMGAWPRVFATALRSPKGQLTLAVVNDAPGGLKVKIELRGPVALPSQSAPARRRRPAD